MHAANWWSFGHGLGMVFLWFLFCIAIITAIAWAYKQTPKNDSETIRNNLKKRYADGEISKEQLDQMISNLKN